MMDLLFGLLVGLALGLTGGGGSILAVPLLLYGTGLPLREAVAVSLAVVGLTALYGAIVQRCNVLWGAGLALGVGGMLGAAPGAWAGAWIPEGVTLAWFAMLMLFIAWRMWRNAVAGKVPVMPWACARAPSGLPEFHWSCAAKLFAAGLLAGVLSGWFGVGGGFLLVPALLLVTAMPMPYALATSLVAIALISAPAFAANLVLIERFPIATAAWFLAGGAVGMTLGAPLKHRLPDAALKRVFAVVVFGVALWVFAGVVL